MRNSASILICDDEKNIRRTLRIILEGEGFAVGEAASGEELLAVYPDAEPDIVILDVKLPGKDGHEVLRAIKARAPAPQVLMISGHGTIHDAVEAVRHGAYDFLEKPLDRDRVILAVTRALESARMAEEVSRLRAAGEEQWELAGESEPMVRLRETIAKVAPTPGRVLILGESGSGKELVARSIHRLSKRAAFPFAKVNCAAIPDELIESELFGHERGAFTGAVARKRGHMELADGGTLFLDEIADMSARAQAKVLRALQTGEINRVGSERALTVDLRIIAATNKDLQAAVKSGAFREDLYFRLNVVPIHVPSLRERPGDIPLLATRFTAEFCQEYGIAPKRFAPSVLAALTAYPFPGNVRELRNLCERLVILSGEVIQDGDIAELLEHPRGEPAPPVAAPAAASLPLREAIDEFERAYIMARLRQAKGNITRAAELLGLERTNLHKKMRALNITRGELSEPAAGEAEPGGG